MDIEENDEIEENGEWTVDQDDLFEDYVHLSVNEVTEDGVFAHEFYFPPKRARELAQALQDWADIVENDE